MEFFLGSNNINLLMPIGHFGTRRNGGKDRASPRYISTCLNKITRWIFLPSDDQFLQLLRAGKELIEPEWYFPLLPFILVNGCHSTGSGWSSRIPRFNLLDIIENVLNVINGKPQKEMIPWYKGFHGTIEKATDDDGKYLDGEYVICGKAEIGEDGCVYITELPIGTWTTKYREQVLDAFRESNKISRYEDYSSDVTVRFIVEMNANQRAEMGKIKLVEFFKLQSKLSLKNMFLFDEKGDITKYGSANEIIESFCKVRRDFYTKRLDNLKEMLNAKLQKLDNQVKFMEDIIEVEGPWNDMTLKKFLEDQITKRYQVDPLQICQKGSGDYTYLTNMLMQAATKEELDKLKFKRGETTAKIAQMTNTAFVQLWTDDLTALEKLYKVRLYFVW